MTRSTRDAVKKLLVAVDFSPGSQAAVALARSLGSVELVHVSRTGIGVANARERLGEVAEGDSHQVRTGRFVDELLAAASPKGVEAIVLGVPGRPQLVRELVRRSRVPVIFARGAVPARVVAAVDFSGSTRAALPVAFEVAEDRALPIELVHVLGGAASAQGDAASRQGVCSLAKLSLERGDLGAASISLREGEPVSALIDATGPSDLVVCGSNGYGRFEELILGGSVALRLVMRGRASVLVVGPRAERRLHERATSIRAIHTQHAVGPAGPESTFLVECARAGERIALEECMECGAFAGIIGEALGKRVVRCRDTTPSAPFPNEEVRS
jgi:nucleotide-binding universal stress UspA family protein